MNLLFVITDITTKGGTEGATLANAKMFASHGHDVTILSLFHASDNPNPISENISIRYVENKSYTSQLSSWKRMILLGKAILKLRKADIDWYSYNFVFSEAFLPGFLLWILGITKNVIACEHFKYDLYSPLITKIRNKVYSKFVAVVTLTNISAKLFRVCGIQAYVIPNMTLLKPGVANKDSKQLIIVGRLSFEKGFDLLIKALPDIKRRHPDWKVLHFGAGHLKNDLIQLSNDLEVDDYICFNGYTNDIRKEMLESSILILPSRHEAFPLTLLEAMMCKLPIVAFACSEGPIDLLSENCGYLVKPESIEDLSNTICIAIEDEEGRLKMANNAFRKVQQYTPDKIYEKWINVLTALSEKNL